MLARNVLIFHSGALGDLIVTWPLAMTLARLFPQSRVYYVVTQQKGALCEKALRLESTDVETGAWHSLFGDEPVLAPHALTLLGRSHTALSFIAGPTDRWSQNVRHIMPAQSRLSCVSTIAGDDFVGHITEHLVSQWGDWPAGQAAARQILQSIASRGLALHQSASRDVVIHPGSGSIAKCWPVECYVQLIGDLRAGGRSVRVLLGEVELEKWPKDQIAQVRNAAEVRTPETYVDLLKEVTTAAVFIGNDSGPGHLAGIVGTPTVSIFGPRDSRRWRPLGPRVKVVSGDFEKIESKQVIDAVAAAEA